MIRQLTLLEIVFDFRTCDSKDRRDKILALISIVEGPEREALDGVLPNYSLSLNEVMKIVLRHVRKFSGQRQSAKQIDSILIPLGEPGDTLCHSATFAENMRLQRNAKNGRGRRRVVTREEKEHLANLSWLEIFRCIFSPRDSQVQGSVEVWELDPDLPLIREQHPLHTGRCGND